MGNYTQKNQKERFFAVVVFGAIFIVVLALSRTLFVPQVGTTIEMSGTVEVVATVHFGEQELFHKQVSIDSPTNAMQVLYRTAVVETSYGGGFVTGINNISSTFSHSEETPEDWFYYVNGVLSPVGAVQYTVVPGDVIRWDFHSWSDTRSVTAVIADFPKPFLQGFQGKKIPTTIVYEAGFEQQASQIQTLLGQYGVHAACVRTDQISSDVQAAQNLILLGTYASHPLIQEINNHTERLGIFVEWDGCFLQIFDACGNQKLQYESGGVIAAMQNFWNPKGSLHGENVVWIVAGVSFDDVEHAVQILMQQPLLVKNCASVVVRGNSVIRVP
ncbi:MAG: DUF4430 domain-containing protein [Candidatus Thermoplasmatota archaeon]